MDNTEGTDSTNYNEALDDSQLDPSIDQQAHQFLLTPL
jgi:hypothetical protein